jgi:sigma-B regulation protein RsbU (phosphoserine phosphatase)
MKVLIAEDDPAVRKALRLSLLQFGYEVIVADDGQNAWKIFDDHPVRIIVSDWIMPRLTGLDLCYKVRARENTDYTYIILLTAINTSHDDFLTAMDSAVDDFLTKPFERCMLRARLHVAERILGFTTQVKHLKELLPICAYCHKIRDDLDYWQRLESYIADHTAVKFSHGICPDCLEKEMAILDRINGQG